jgi:hypothetical protein
LYARWQSATNALSCSAAISSVGPKNIAKAGIEHDGVDPVGVEIGDAGPWARDRRPAQALP